MYSNSRATERLPVLIKLRFARGQLIQRLAQTLTVLPVRHCCQLLYIVISRRQPDGWTLARALSRVCPAPGLPFQPHSPTTWPTPPDLACDNVTVRYCLTGSPKVLLLLARHPLLAGNRMQQSDRVAARSRYQAASSRLAGLAALVRAFHSTPDDEALIPRRGQRTQYHWGLG